MSLDLFKQLKLLYIAAPDFIPLISGFLSAAIAQDEKISKNRYFWRNRGFRTQQVQARRHRRGRRRGPAAVPPGSLRRRAQRDD